MSKEKKLAKFSTTTTTIIILFNSFIYSNEFALNE